MHRLGSLCSPVGKRRVHITPGTFALNIASLASTPVLQVPRQSARSLSSVLLALLPSVNFVVENQACLYVLLTLKALTLLGCRRSCSADLLRGKTTASSV